MNRPSLGRVLLLAIGGVAVGAVVLTALVTFGLARLGAEGRALNELEREASRLADAAAELPCEGRALSRFARELGPRARFVPDDAAGEGPGASRPDRPSGRTRVTDGEVLYASEPATLCGRAGTIFVFRPPADVPALPEGFGGRLVLAALAALVGSSVVAYFLARRVSRPLTELAGAARTVATGSLADGGLPTVAASDAAEVAELKEAFGGMLSDLASARDHEKAFLLSVSHELRTPLTAIRGYGEALSDGTSRRPRHAGEVILRESKRLERLVQDLLDLARLESGEFSVEPRRADLSDIAASVAEALTPAAADSGVALEVSRRASAIVTTDPDRVHQMVANLVENALRVTPRDGSVTIDVDASSIAVIDSGPGLEPGDAEHAFERFYLWRKYSGERPVGSGLGLAIVGELAQRLGIRMDVRSSNGAGARFELHFADA